MFSLYQPDHDCINKSADEHQLLPWLKDLQEQILQEYNKKYNDMISKTNLLKSTISKQYQCVIK